jgi:curved DNA-binding protein CbpA
MHQTLSSDLLQAVHLFFADQLFRTDGNVITYRIGMDEIKREFRKKALAFHPDRAEFLGKNRVRLEEKFKEINEAYTLLKETLIDKHLILNPSARPFSRPPRRKTDFTHPQASRRTRASQFRSQRKSNAHQTVFTGHSPQRRKTDRPPFFYKGMLPKRKLRLGEFLFYNQIIAWQTLIDAIVWQYHARPKLGQIARELNYLSQQDILQILQSKNLKEPFGEAAVRLGFLDTYKRFVILGRQKSYDLPFGKFFVNNRILNEIAITEHIRKNRLHNIQF